MKTLDDDSTDDQDEIEYVVPGEALTALRAALLEANHLFQTESFGGRVGIVKAIAAVTEFLSCFETLKDDLLLTPLIVLNSALDDLNRGKVQDLVSLGAGPPNRDPAGNLRLTTQALAIFASDFLKELGLSRPDADKRVAESLRKAGVEAKGANEGDSAGSISAETIKGWREIASNGKRNPRLTSFVSELRRSDVRKVFQGKAGTQSVEVVLSILGILLQQFRADAAG